MIRHLAKTTLRRPFIPFPLLRRPFSMLPGISISQPGMGSQSQSRTLRDIFNINSGPKTRNVAIIAHVDHGKTTLVDCLLKNSGISLMNECAMDMNELERERGITILSKCTSLLYKDHKINIVDTPGHQDFGGEVEQVLSMVDGVILVVCSTEGPMPQTKFVLQKALKHNLIPIVVVNKVDRESSRIGDVENEIFDLFCSLDTTDTQLEYPLFYASAKEGWATSELKKRGRGVHELLSTIITRLPSPKLDNSDDVKMLITQTESSHYLGKMLIGKLNSGKIATGDKLQAVDQKGNLLETAKILKITKRYGTSTIEIDQAFAGDIVSIAGFRNVTVGHTINPIGKNFVIPSTPIEPSMLSVEMYANDSPLRGSEGGSFTVGQLRDRIIRESQNDVALKIDPKNKSGRSINVVGRGDLHLGVLFEKMRREGMEFMVSPPQTITKVINGALHEPVEKITVEVDEMYEQRMIDLFQARKGNLVTSDKVVKGKKATVQLIFEISSRGFIGCRSEIMGVTKGTAIVRSEFSKYEKHKGTISRNTRGAIISLCEGKATAYALSDIEKKGRLFIDPGSVVYPGMVIGEHLLEADVEMNPCKQKRVTNVRTHSHEDKIILLPAKKFTIDEALTYVRDDEIVEVTPRNVRIRKKMLDAQLRRRVKKDMKNMEKLLGRALNNDDNE